MRSCTIVIGLLMTVGCGMNPPPLAGPVSVNGKVVTSDGKPVGGVAVNLHPLENGYLKTVDVKPDGTFTVETQAGKYAYYFTPKVGTKAMPPQVANLAEANMERTVNVSSGQELVINLP
jgi:hypothetical protein